MADDSDEDPSLTVLTRNRDMQRVIVFNAIAFMY